MAVGDLLDWYENDEGHVLANVKLANRFGIARIKEHHANLHVEIVFPLGTISSTDASALSLIKDIAQSWVDDVGGEALPK